MPLCTTPSHKIYSRINGNGWQIKFQRSLNNGNPTWVVRNDKQRLVQPVTFTTTSCWQLLSAMLTIFVSGADNFCQRGHKLSALARARNTSVQSRYPLLPAQWRHALALQSEQRVKDARSRVALKHEAATNLQKNQRVIKKSISYHHWYTYSIFVYCPNILNIYVEFTMLDEYIQWTNV